MARAFGSNARAQSDWHKCPWPLVAGRCLSVLLAAVTVLAAKAGAAPSSPPNIVMILTDDHDLLSGTLAYMPHLQSLLVERGTSFDNMLVPLSLCCPARTTILRGQYPHNSQVLTNALPLGGFDKVYALNLEAATIATVLHAAGYRTALFGKYLNGYPPADKPSYVPPGWDEWFSPAAGNPYFEYNYTLNENGRLVKYGGTPSDYLTDVIYARAIDFISRNSTSTQPLFVYFATYAPHAPSTPAPRHADLFPDLKAPRSPAFDEEDVSDKPGYISRRDPLTQQDKIQINQSYRKRVQSLQAVDEAIAGLVDALRATGRLANSYIIFTGDNGYHMGDHRLQPGKYTPYETDLRVPLVVRGPSVPAGATRAEVAANVDLAGTFADIAGVAAPPFSDGRSLLPLLREGPVSAWRQAFLIEEFGGGEFVLGDETDVANPDSKLGVLEPADPQDLDDTTKKIPSYYGFWTPSYKYVEYQSDEKELYVLSADPYELTNQAAAVSPAVASKLTAYVRTLDTCVGDACRAAESAPPPPLLVADFTATPALPISTTPVTLTATASGTPPYTYSWAVGGKTASGSPVTLTLAAGSYAAALHVRDAIGAEISVVRTIVVRGSPRRHLVAGPAIVDTTPLPSTFFAMSALGGLYPPMRFGTLAHQDFAWDRIEPSRGRFDFSYFDDYIAAAKQHGLVDTATNTANFVMTLSSGSPRWAVADQSTCGANCSAPPDDIQDWKDFITALVQHYNGVTQPHIKYYEPWNEFNVGSWWKGTDAQMVALAKAAYQIVHQDPYSMLLTPSVAGLDPFTGLTSYLQAGGARYADGGAFHGYMGVRGDVSPVPMPEEDQVSGCTQFVDCYLSIITKATKMRAVFDENGLAGKPIYQTEGSWAKRAPADSDTQVAWLARYLLLQAGLRSTLNLQMAAWFTWSKASFGWGTISDASDQPTAAGLAYGRVYDWVVGATMSQPCSGGSDGTWTCVLTRDGGYKAKAIWNVNGLASFKPGAGFTQYRDLAGNITQIAVGASIAIGPKPILVEKPAPGTLPAP
jgi:N-acetylglucosamine-6-sulfatase